MFVVGTVSRAVPDRTTPGEFRVHWPVVFENTQTGMAGSPVVLKASREDAEKVADALNAALETKED
jgi:hypothetical protein